MSSDSNLTCSAKTIAFDAMAALDIWRTYLRELRNDLLATLLIVSFSMWGVIRLVVNFVLVTRHPGLISFALAIPFGLLFCSYILGKEWRFLHLLRADLANLECEVLRVCPLAAITVDLSNNQSAVAFDCGPRTLIVTTNWWLPEGRTHVTWTKLGSQKRFPSTDFSITRLPLTGRVIEVDMNGRKLKVEPDDPEAPIDSLIEVEQDNSQECFIVDKPLHELVQKGGRKGKGKGKGKGSGPTLFGT